MFPFSLFLARGKGKKEREKPLLSTPSRVHYHVIPNKVLFRHKKLGRVV
jgi:hypothetical protein